MSSTTENDGHFRHYMSKDDVDMGGPGIEMEQMLLSAFWFTAGARGGDTNKYSSPLQQMHKLPCPYSHMFSPEYP